MKIIKASHLGMCFGVRDAIDLAIKASRSQPLTVLGDLVHNETVLADLRRQGVAIERRVEQVATPDVMITAHGASERAVGRIRALGLNVLEATCPLVHHVHRVVRELVAEGYHPVIIGKRDHVEVRGLTEDLEEFDVVLGEEDLAGLRERARFGVAAQTTQPIARVRHLVSLLRRRFPHSEVRLVDTVCQPTKQRQAAAIELALQCDIVIVIGGAQSNNTRELVQTCQQHCPRVIHIQGADELRSLFFNGDETVGVTAGTSTPDTTIAEVMGWLEEFARFQTQVAEHVAKC